MDSRVFLVSPVDDAPLAEPWRGMRVNRVKRSPDKQTQSRVFLKSENPDAMQICIQARSARAGL
jgi:hypothetical protein